MRILVVTNYYPPHYFGGYELKCQQIVESLRERGHDLFVLAGDHASPGVASGGEPQVSRTLRYDTPETGFFARLSIEQWNRRATADRIGDFKPDVIYLWNQRGITLGPSLAACESGIAKVYQIGDFWPNTYIKPGRRAMLFGWLRKCVPYGARSRPDLSPAIVVGSWMADEMKQKFGARTVYHVPHGVELPPEPSPDRLGAGVPRFLFAGRIDPEKGLILAIRAFAALHAGGGIADFEFNIVGGGDEDHIAECKRLVADHGLAGKIQFLGKTREIGRYYASHAVLLMPTLMREPFGLVIIEAMAHGMVPVVTDAYGPREIVRHLEDGLRFKPGDVDDLAANIRSLAADPALRIKLGTAARAAVAERFRIGHEVARIESLLGELAEEGQNRYPTS